MTTFLYFDNILALTELCEHIIGQYSNLILSGVKKIVYRGAYDDIEALKIFSIVKIKRK